MSRRGVIMAIMIILLTVILLAAYTPASITVKIKSFITPTPKSSGDELIVYVLAEWEGKDALGLTVYTVRQWVEYNTNCTNIHCITAWINSSGLPGYIFHSEITIGDQEWSREGTLKAPRISPLTLQDSVGEGVGETMSIYFAGQVASATTSWTLYPTKIHYIASATAIANTPTNTGWITACK